MANATLLISAEGSASIRRAMGQMVGEARGAMQAMNADARRASQARRRNESEESAATRRDIVTVLEARRRGQIEATRATQREARNRVTAEQASAQTSMRIILEESRLFEREARNRTRITERSQRDQTRAAEQGSRNRRRIAELEAQHVARSAQVAARARFTSEGSGGGAGAGGGGGGFRAAGRAAWGAFSSYAGMVGDARQRRALTERVWNTAVAPAGADRAEAQASFAEMTRFAQRTGIDSAQLADAAASAQTEFNVLGNRSMTASERTARLQSFLATAEMGRDTGTDLGELSRLHGMLSGAGVTDPTVLRRTMLYGIGASQQGAVELGSITREAMGAMQRRMGMAQAELGPNATQEQRVRATTNTFADVMSELQVLRSNGISVRRGGENMAAMNTALRSRSTQDAMLTNIRNASGISREQRQRLENTLYERDPSQRGRLRLRAKNQDALAFGETVAQVIGNDSTQFANIFGGSGQGNRQSLQRNWMTTLGAFMNEDANGQTGFQRRHQLRNMQGTALTEADLQRQHDVMANDSQSQIQRGEEERNNALTENTNAVNNLAQRYNEFMQRNPMLQAIAPQLPGLLGGGGGGGGGAGGGSGGGGGGGGLLGAVLPSLGEGGGGLAVAGLATAGRFLAGAMPVVRAAVGGVVAGDLVNRGADVISERINGPNRDGGIDLSLVTSPLYTLTSLFGEVTNWIRGGAPVIANPGADEMGRRAGLAALRELNGVHFNTLSANHQRTIEQNALEATWGGVPRPR